MGLGREAGLDLARGVGVDLVRRHACVAQQLQRGLQGGALRFVAQQHQAACAGFEVQLMPGGNGVETALAVLRQALQRGSRRAVLAGMAAPAPQPAKMGAREAARQPQRGIGPREPQRPAPAGHGPGVEQIGCQQATGGKTGFFSGGAALLEDGDFVAVAGQLVRGGDADDAGAHDGNLHEFGMFLASCA